MRFTFKNAVEELLFKKKQVKEAKYGPPPKVEEYDFFSPAVAGTVSIHPSTVTSTTIPSGGTFGSTLYGPTHTSTMAASWEELMEREEYKLAVDRLMRALGLETSEQVVALMKEIGL